MTTTVRCCTVPLANKPGQLAEVTRALADEKINIEAFESEGLGEVGYVRLYTSDADKTENILRKKGFACIGTQLVEATLPNRPGELTKVCRALAEADINIESCFGTAGTGPGEGRILLRVSDAARARKVIDETTRRPTAVAR